MTTLFTDFDGVLFDSLPEAYRLGRFAYRGTDAREPVDARDYARFAALRFFVTRSAQYWRIFRLVEICGLDAPDADYRAAHARLAREGHEEKMRAFDAAFLGLRKKLIAEEHAFWLSLSKPYPFFEALKPRFLSAFSPIVVTTKNREAVLENLAQEGVRGVPEKILDKADCARFGGKRALIADFMARERVGRAVFVDDIPENVRECDGLPRLECLHAGWGYGDPRVPGLSPETVLARVDEASDREVKGS